MPVDDIRQRIWRDIAAEDDLEARLRVPRGLVALATSLLVAMAVAAALITVPHREPLIPVGPDPVGTLALPADGRAPATLVGRAVTARVGDRELAGWVVAVQDWAPTPGAPGRAVVVVEFEAIPTGEPPRLLVDLGRRSLLADIVARGGGS